ncbi:MAG TPA: DEAD/DEAH box helicase [Thermoanaerobaculia bacterium]|nr:DEAD/DEAH box helicase [Thermoanaerobaculia bacterium]
MTFSSFDLDARLQRGIADLGFTVPTPIQQAGLPPALEGRDVLACAMTGSGKTAAFVLPILQRLLGQKRGVTRALVVAPTRELAAQIVEHFNDLGRHTDIRAAAVYGGVGMAPQERDLRRGIDVIVACPGRLLDHFQYPYAKLAGLEVLVLDEVDRMLDMGFLPDIKRVLKHLPPVAQTLFYSATLPAPIQELARQMLRNPVAIDVERPSAPATGVRQAIYPVRQDLKPALLLELLRGDQIQSALVFTRTKHRANRLADFLERQGVACDRVHGNRSQTQRTQALAGFKAGRFRVLVATDIAARGIDVEGLSHVVNFDVPNVPDDYIHRVGRTARAGATGEALTFVSQEELGDLRAIERTVAKTLPRRTLESFNYQTKPAERFEIPIGERIAEIRARKAEDRARAKANAERRAQHQPGRAAAGTPSAGRPARSAGMSGGPGTSTGSGPARPARSAGPTASARRQGAEPRQGKARASAPKPWWTSRDK